MKCLLAGVLLLASAACSGGGTPTAPTTPSTPPLPPTSETFTGTVPVGGIDTHTFVVKLSNGLVTINLTQAGPPPTIVMGLGIGIISNGACTPLSTAGSIVTPAGPNSQLNIANFTSGTYCVAVFDVGNQTADVAYSVTVTHY